MRISDEDIERIVREVIQRLMSAGVQVAPQRVALELDERLITTAQLEGKLDGIGQLIVPRKAIVTPLVRDELKDKNVELIRKDT